MNYSTAMMAVMDDIIPVKVIYDEQKPHSSPVSSYIFKTLDKSIKVDDYVVIPTDTRHGMTVGKIIAVGYDTVDVDFDSNLEIKWIIDRVDIETHNSVLENQKVWIDQLKLSEKHAKRQEVKKNMESYLTDADSDFLKGVKGLTAIESKPAPVEDVE